jgi:hypothetical protein
MSTIQKSPQHLLNLFQSAIFTSRSLATELTFFSFTLPDPLFTDSLREQTEL